MILGFHDIFKDEILKLFVVILHDVQDIAHFACPWLLLMLKMLLLGLTGIYAMSARPFSLGIICNDFPGSNISRT